MQTQELRAALAALRAYGSAIDQVIAALSTIEQQQQRAQTRPKVVEIRSCTRRTAA